MESSLTNDQIPSPSLSCLRFSLDEIKRATNDFKLCLGEGWLGKVYFGMIWSESGIGQVAVKCLNLERLKGFSSESQKEILTARHHANIISLVGFCDEGDKKILVYEFIPNGSLYEYLYTNQDHKPRLTVEQRLEICLGVAKGLSYLHSGTDFHIIHGDLTSRHILLDSSLVPKISGFGFSTVHAAGPSSSQIVTNSVYGTEGYVAPECYEPNYKSSRKTDVYAFGVVLLEVLCERKAWERLLVLALPFVMRGELPKFTPEYVEKYISPDCARVCEKLITDCLEFQQEKRPYMNQVVSELELALKLQKQYKDQNIKFQANTQQPPDSDSSQLSLGYSRFHYPVTTVQAILRANAISLSSAERKPAAHFFVCRCKLQRRRPLDLRRNHRRHPHPYHRRSRSNTDAGNFDHRRPLRASITAGSWFSFLDLRWGGCDVRFKVFSSSSTLVLVDMVVFIFGSAMMVVVMYFPVMMEGFPAEII